MLEKLFFFFNFFLDWHKPVDAYLSLIAVNRSNMSRSFCNDDELSMLSVEILAKLLKIVLFFDNDIMTDVSLRTILKKKQDISIDIVKRWSEYAAPMFWYSNYYIHL